MKKCFVCDAEVSGKYKTMLYETTDKQVPVCNTCWEIVTADYDPEEIPYLTIQDGAVRR